MATETKTVKQDVAEDPVVQEIRKSLTSEAERVSSASTGVEDTISKAVNRTQQAGEATGKRIESSFNRQRTQALGAGQRSVTQFSEGRRGFATQLTALRNVVEETDNYLKDLDQRKEEALLANDAQTLSAVNALTVQGEQMKMEALQSTFDNLVAVSNMGLQARQFELGQAEAQRQFDLNYEFEGKKFQLQKDQQSNQEKQAMAGIALEFGIDIAPDDTLDSLVGKAAATGAVSERRALELEQMRASIRNSNAQAARALKQDASEKPFDPTTAEILARAYNAGNTEFLAGLKTNEQYAAVVSKASELTKTMTNSLKEAAKQYDSQESYMNFINSQVAGLDDTKKARVLAAATEVANSTNFKGDLTEVDFPTIKGVGTGFQQTSMNLWGGVYEFFTGRDLEGYGMGN